MFRRRRMLQQLDDEIREHIETETQDNIARGMSPEDAHYAAMRKFGNVTRVKEETRAVWSLVWLEQLLQDIRFGLRMLRKSPGFAAVAILTLALGIGANTAIFSVIDAVLLRNMPYPSPERLVILREFEAHQGPESVSWMDFLDWRTQNHSFEAIAVYRQDDFALTNFGKPRQIRAGRVSASFFTLLGARTLLGRTFGDAEDKPGANPIAVLSYEFWRSAMGGDPDAVGKTLTLDEKAYTVVGVLAPGFKYFQGRTDLYIPAGLMGSDQAWLFRANHQGLTALARLLPGHSLASARADIATIMERIDDQYAATNKGQEATLNSLYEYTFGDFQLALFILLGAVTCVMLIACANVANLLLARTASRQREFAIRAAIGAGKQRVMRQLLTESVLLSMIGGVFGLLIAMWSIGPLVHIAPPDIPRLSETRIDVPVFLVTFVIAILTGILFGLAPVYQSMRIDINDELKKGSPRGTAGRSRQWLRSGLLISQVAIALVLVTASGLLIRCLSKALSVNPGFRVDHLLALDVNLPRAKYETDEQQHAFRTEALQHIRNLPGVDSASAVYCSPLVGDCWDSIFILSDRPVPSIAELPRAVFNVIDPQYFQVMYVPLLGGRYFTMDDTKQTAPVVLINETMARQFWPHENPVGKRIKQDFPNGKNPFMEIVGVVGDLNQNGPDAAELPEVFEPEAQSTMRSMTFVVRTKTDPMVMASAAEGAIQAVDNNRPVSHIQPMALYLSDSTERRKFSTILLSLFGGLALLLAAVGIYGVVAYAMTQRTNEIGIRMALGSQRRDVLFLVVKFGLRLALAGVGIGLAASLVLTRFLQSMLFEVKPTDPVTFAAVTILLVLVSLAACFIPARRAMGVDPMIALRYE